MSTIFLLCIYSVLIAAASFFGGWLPNFIKLTHLRMQITMSLVAGLMLGVALLHLLPHSYELLGEIGWVAGGMLTGVLVMFFLMRMFHVHHHGDGDDDDHQEDHSKSNGSQQEKGFSWYGLFFGMAVHTILDGFALASSAAIEGAAADGFELIAFGTFLAIVLHKPLDALSITSFMERGGLSPGKRLAANFCFALACPLGVFLFWIGAFNWFAETQTVVGVTLAFSAGFFLCIALADLLPEVHFHSHDRAKLSIALLVGVALALTIELFHTHEHDGHVDSEKHQLENKQSNSN